MKKNLSDARKRINQKEFVNYLKGFVLSAEEKTGDSDRHISPLFSLAVASKAKIIVELGVKDGSTTLPLLLAAYVNNGKLISVDIKKTSFICPPKLRSYWSFVKSDSIKFLKKWDKSVKMDFVFIDDWHAYRHVKKELEYIDAYVGPSSIVLMHDLMYGNTDPFYHSDLTLPEGQWAEGGSYRAVAELDKQFWEWATLPWNNGLTILRKKYSSKYHAR